MPTKSERRQLENIRRELIVAAEGVVRRIGAQLLSELEAVTPKDSGFTANSWRASRTRPVTTLVGNRSKSGVARAKAAQETSRAAIAGFTLGARTLHIANPSPNSGALNEGSSAREPAAFVQRAISKAVRAASARSLVIRRR